MTSGKDGLTVSRALTPTNLEKRCRNCNWGVEWQCSWPSLSYQSPLWDWLRDRVVKTRCCGLMLSFLLSREFRGSEISILFQQDRLLSWSQRLLEFSDIAQAHLQGFSPWTRHESVSALQFGPTGLKFTLNTGSIVKKSAVSITSALCFAHHRFCTKQIL